MAKYMERRNNNKRIEVRWGGGDTTLFFAPHDGSVELLDYEYDYEWIHEECGGMLYYQSRSGASGAGYIEKTEKLVPVGFYRVDTAYNDWHCPVGLTDEVSIMLPYVSHERDKKDTLEKYPVVIIVGKTTIIYCGFYTNMNEILRKVLSGEKMGFEPRILKRKFFNTNPYHYWIYEEVVELEFYNLFGYSFYPWEFVTAILEDYKVQYPEELVYRIFHLSTSSDGKLVRTVRIGQQLYAVEALDTDPLEKGESIPGWETADTHIMYKVRENDVYIVGWELAKEAYEKKVERIARFFPEAEGEEFKNFAKNSIPSVKYIEFELNVPKLLFFMYKGEQLAKVRKGIAHKVTQDAFSTAHQYVADFNDRQVLEAVPDNLVITLNDSYAAGNCQPGTQAFVDKFFPGKTETTAGELKKYADNWNVMRIFRLIAKRDGITTSKVKLELPE